MAVHTGSIILFPYFMHTNTLYTVTCTCPHDAKHLSSFCISFSEGVKTLFYIAGCWKIAMHLAVAMRCIRQIKCHCELFFSGVKWPATDLSFIPLACYVCS